MNVVNEGDDADGRSVASLEGVVGVYRNSTNWSNNASFLLPLAATVLVGLAGAVLRSAALLGFAAFLGPVTPVMLPVVLATWRQTATAVVLTRGGLVSLHRGRTLKSLAWERVEGIRRRETQGNVRWEVSTADGERVLLDGEIEDLRGLLRTARALAALPPDD